MTGAPAWPSLVSADWDSFDDKFSLLPGVSTPLDQNTVKHSLKICSVLASLQGGSTLGGAVISIFPGWDQTGVRQLAGCPLTDRSQTAGRQYQVLH